MTPRVALVLALALLSITAQAGSWETSGDFRPRGSLMIQVSGQIHSILVINRHGRAVPVPVPPGTRLGDTLALPPGDWAEITLILDGPLTVTVDGAAPVSLDLETVTVPLEDPEADSVVLDWSLPDALLARLHAGAPDPAVRAALTAAIRDGVIARP